MFFETLPPQSNIDTLQAKPKPPDPLQQAAAPAQEPAPEIDVQDDLTVQKIASGSAAPDMAMNPNQIDFPEISPQDLERLQRVAQSGGGRQLSANTSSRLQSLMTRFENIDTSRMSEDERQLVEHMKQLTRSAMNGDPKAAKLLDVGNKLLIMAQENPEKAREIYGLLERMASGELKYDQLTDEQKRLMTEIGIDNQEQIDRLGIENIFQTARAMAGTRIHPEQFSQAYHEQVMPIIEQASADGLFQDAARELGVSDGASYESEDSDSTNPTMQPEEEQRKPDVSRDRETNGTDVMFERQLELHRQKTKDEQDKLKFQRDMTDRKIQEMRREYERTDEHARDLKDKRAEHEQHLA